MKKYLTFTLDDLINEFGQEPTNRYVKKMECAKEAGFVYDNELETIFKWMTIDRLHNRGYWRDIQSGLQDLIKEFGKVPVSYYLSKFEEREQRGFEYVDPVHMMWKWMTQDKKDYRGYWRVHNKSKSISNKTKRHGGS